MVGTMGQSARQPFSHSAEALPRLIGIDNFIGLENSADEETIRLFSHRLTCVFENFRKFSCRKSNFLQVPMARNWGFLYFLVSLTTVLCSLTISTLDVEENYYDVEFDSTQRSKRDVDTTEHIIWRDNHETAKLGAKNVTPTIKRVVHHGIYPSLEIEVPINLNGNSASKTTRSARSVQQGDQYRTHGEERDKNPQIPIRITYQAVYPPAIRNISGK